MSVQSSSDGKRFLESLILRAETILGKMIVKLTETHVPLEEMVPMINSVYGFVNVWEAPLKDISLDHVLNGGGEFAADEAKSREERIMEQVNSLEERVEDRGAAVAEGGRRSAVRHDPDAEPMFEFLEQSLNDLYVP